MINRKSFYALKQDNDGETNWENYKQIESWGKSSNYKCFIIKGKLYLIGENDVMIYEKYRKDKLNEKEQEK